jgi:hypothetical protein
MTPSLVSLDTNPKRSNAGGSNEPTNKEKFELLSDELKDLVLDHASHSSECENMGKWCTAVRCDETVWQRACVAKGWATKPDHFNTWRVWYARNCKPNWAQRIDDSLREASYSGHLEMVRLLLDQFFGGMMMRKASNSRPVCSIRSIL